MCGRTNLLDPLGVARKATNIVEKLPGGNAVTSMQRRLAVVPGSPEALVEAMKQREGGKPFGPERSALDIAGGGTKLSQNKTARTIGRTIGTAAAAFFAAPAVAAAMGSAAPAAAPAALGTTEAGATALGAGVAPELAAAYEAGAIGTTTSAGEVAFGGALPGTGGLTSEAALGAVSAPAAAGGAAAVASKSAAPAEVGAESSYATTAESQTAATAASSGQKTMSDALLAAITGLDISDAAALLNLGMLAAVKKTPKVTGEVAALEPPPTEGRDSGRVPTQDFFTERRRRASGDPTALTGPGGVRMGDVMLGRATVLGA